MTVDGEILTEDLLAVGVDDETIEELLTRDGD